MHNDNSEGVGVTITAPLCSLMTGLVSLLVSDVGNYGTAEAYPVIKGRCGAEDYGNKGSLFNTLISVENIHTCSIWLRFMLRICVVYR